MSYFRDVTKLQSGENPRDKVQGVIEKPVSGQQYSSILYVPASANVSKDVIKPGPGNMRRFSLTSTDSTQRWLHFFDKASVPITDDVPVIKEIVEAAVDSAHPTRLRLGGDYWDMDYFKKGLAWGISSTKDKFTDAGGGTNFLIKANFV